MQLSVIIVNYNVKHFLGQCLSSVRKACRNLEAEVLVIDNHSADGSAEYLPGRFPEISFIWKTGNAGFARANNEGWRQARGEYVLFLNPDTLLAEDSLEQCLNFMRQRPDAGALGVKMIDGTGAFLPESKRGLPGPWAAFCKMTGLTRLFPRSRWLARYYLGHLDAAHSHPVDVLSGACMLVKREVLEQTGGFDEDYFMYAEDIDLSYRILQAGWRNYYFAGTRILHFKGESTVRESRAHIRHFYGTMIRFVQKHHRGLSAQIYILLLRILIAVKLLLLREGRQPEPWALPDTCYTSTGDPAVRTILDKHFRFVQPFSQLTEVPAGSAVLLSETRHSFADILRLMEQWPGRNPYLLHATGEPAITGSARRGEQGVVLT